MYRKAIAAYEPRTELEAQDKKVMLDYIDQFPHNVLTRDNAIAHLTSSGFILNEKMDKALMVYHRLYDSWAWTGGHADGDEDLLAVAIREAREETGIKKVQPLTTDIMSLNILPVWYHQKNGKPVSTHLHLNVTYVLMASELEPLQIKADENTDVGWIEVQQIDTYCSEPLIVPIYKKLIKAARDWN